MTIYLISNNLVLEDIEYKTDTPIEEKRITRPLSIEGEKASAQIAKKISVDYIYSSNFASALATAKYFAIKNDILIEINKSLNDSKIGDLGRHNIKMLRYMQDRNFDYKYQNGESLNDTAKRMHSVFKNIIEHSNGNCAIFTHKRAIMSLLLKYCDKSFNLNDRLMLSHENKVIIDDTENDIDIIKIEIDGKKIISIDFLDLL